MKISKGQLESHARRRAERGPQVDPKTKVCTVCKQEKQLQTEFRKKKCKYKLANGKAKTVYYWNSECNDCANARIERWKQRKKEAGEYDAMVKQWEKNRRERHGVEYINRMHRRWYRKQRGKKFTLPWKKYRRGYKRAGIQYRTTEVLKYLDRFMILDHKHSQRLNGRILTENQTRQLHRWRSGESKTISEIELDKWSTYFDLPLWEIEEVAIRVDIAV